MLFTVIMNVKIYIIDKQIAQRYTSIIYTIFCSDENTKYIF